MVQAACPRSVSLRVMTVFAGGCAPVYADFSVCVSSSHATQTFRVVSCQGSWLAVGVPSRFGAVRILLPPPQRVLKNFVTTPFKDVRSGTSLYFLSDPSVTQHLLPGVVGGRVIFGTSWTWRMLVLEGRNFGFKWYFRVVLISSRKIDRFF